MPNVLLCSKFDEQLIEKLASDPRVQQWFAGVIGLGGAETPVVRLAICQDGRDAPKFPTEGPLFERMIEKLEEKRWKKAYSLRSTIRVEWSTFSFFDNTLPDLSAYNIFFMTGFRVRHRGMAAMPDRLDNLFNIARNWASANSETAPGAPADVKMFWQVRRRVCYNQMMYIGVCGGAVCAGHRYAMSGEPPYGPPLFDFFHGAQVVYYALMAPNLCHIEDRRTLYITSGSALMLHITPTTTLAASIRVTKNNKGWDEWSAEATLHHQREATDIAKCIEGPFWHPECGLWYFRVDGCWWQCSHGWHCPSRRLSSCGPRSGLSQLGDVLELASDPAHATTTSVMSWAAVSCGQTNN